MPAGFFTTASSRIRPWQLGQHYLPLLYAAGAAGDDAVSFPIEGFDLGSISMRSVIFGEG
jgi:aromatic ring-opening dioxygenase catalytic subunit (LigB family)